MRQQWEVEQKYLLDQAADLREKLDCEGARFLFVEQHLDTYLAHPARNFRQTDEAFRIRRVNNDACATYKGPRLPGPVKTRQEIELRIEANEIEQWLQMLCALGFRTLPPIKKVRNVFSLACEGHNFAVAIDEVDQLGTFAEIELIVTNFDKLGQAREAIESLGHRLNLHHSQPKSYLSQLLTKLGIETDESQGQ